MKENLKIFLVFIILLSRGVAFPSDLSDLQDMTKISFIKIEETWRVSKYKQKERIAEIYKETVPSIYEVHFSYPISPNQLLKIPENLPPDELADWFLKEHRLSQFIKYAKERGLNLLRKNMLETKRLIKNDLLSAEDKERERALMYVSEFKLSEFNEDVLNIFLHSKELEMKDLDVQRESKKQRLETVSNNKEYQAIKTEI